MGCLKRGVPGQCGGCGEGETCTGSVRFNDTCDGNNLNTVSNVVTLPGGGTVSCSTGSGFTGTCLISLGASAVGTCTYSISKTGYTTATGSFDFACGDEIVIDTELVHPGVTTSGHIGDCSADSVGATITIGGDYSATTTTDSAGHWSIFVPISVGTITIECSKAGYVTQTQNVTISCGTWGLTAGGIGAGNFNLVPDEEHECLLCTVNGFDVLCSNIVPKQAEFTGPWGTVVADFNTTTGRYEITDVDSIIGVCTNSGCSTANAAAVLSILLRLFSKCGFGIEVGQCFNRALTPSIWIPFETGASGSPGYYGSAPNGGTIPYFTVHKTNAFLTTNLGANFTCDPYFVDGWIFDSSGASDNCTTYTQHSYYFTVVPI